MEFAYYIFMMERFLAKLVKNLGLMVHVHFVQTVKHYNTPEEVGHVQSAARNILKVFHMNPYIVSIQKSALKGSLGIAKYLDSTLYKL